MQIKNGELFFSPSDLITFMDSPFASHMERWRLHDPSISDLMDPEDQMLKTLQQKGYDHEDAFLEDLKDEDKSVVFIERASTELMQARTRDAMMSGADVIAQLGQPTQGSHPDESGQSILEYLLQEHATIPADLGVFLPQTYRMHPDVCSLISDQVYDGRLQSAEQTEKHIIALPPEILPKQFGVHFIPVDHEGNTQGSEEEVAVIATLAEQLIGQLLWSGRNVDWADMLFVAPYNYQVNLLRAALPAEARIGSVDKFQGQEAPIVFVSMCASDASESPRGIDFLFSKNRLNVAISRAQSLAIVVGSPGLATTPVSNLRQMELINFYSEIVRHGSSSVDFAPQQRT